MSRRTVAYAPVVLVLVVFASTSPAAVLRGQISGTIEENWTSPHSFNHYPPAIENAYGGAWLNLPAQVAESNRWIAGGGMMSATVVANASASFGSLRAYALASESLTTAGTFQQQAPHSHAFVAYSDSLRVIPDWTHPAGSLVVVHAQLAVEVDPDSIVAGQAWVELTADFDIYSWGATPVLLHYWCERTAGQGAPPTLVLEANGTVVVGEETGFEGSLDVTAGIEPRYGSAPPFSAIAMLDVMNTAHSSFWFDDPTVRFTTASGATYAVPEPSTALAAAAALVGFPRRRRP